jgi:hypothetical protein
MNPRKTLDKINSEEKANTIISRDEESAVMDTSAALQMAEDLILRLPAGAEGRDEWLSRFGQSAEAKNLKRKLPKQ